MTLYPLCNHLAAQQDAVPSIYWHWEMSIPLLPAFIVPYMSIDLFFALAPFLCTDRQEVYRLGRRLGLAIVLACVCFIVFPLRVGFPRQQVPGIFGPIFDFLFGFDQPFNQFPSLHIALAFILRWTYHRHLRGALLWAFHFWFALISASTLLVHQHQVVDLPGGLLLALLCFYVFPRPLDLPQYQATPQAMEMGVRYGLATAACFLTAWWVSGWGLLLLWPGVSLALVSLGYAYSGPIIFQKRQGQLSTAATVLLAPYLLGLWLSRHYYWRRDTIGPAEVCPGLWIGPLPRGDGLHNLLQRGGLVIDLTAEHDTPASLRMRNCLNLPVLDLLSPDGATVERALASIDAARAAQQPVYLYCALGYGRSVKLAAAYLLHAGHAINMEAALAHCRQARPITMMPTTVSANRENA